MRLFSASTLTTVEILNGNALRARDARRPSCPLDTGRGVDRRPGSPHGGPTGPVPWVSLEPVEVPALDGAGVALTLAGADYVHVAGGEGVCLDDIADVERVAVVETELTQGLLGRHVPLCRNAPSGGLVTRLAETSPKPELHGGVAVVHRSF